jgi:thiosulfate/3-mercaptopyruvate sulfurtransferase
MPRRGISSLRPVLFSMEGVAMPAMPLFISVSEAASLPNRCFIDVRSRVVHGWDALGAYSKGHISGAQFLAFDRVFARDPVFELGRHPWPDRRTVAAHLLGVLGPAGNAHHRVIFYDDGGMNFAARAALCARWAGFKNAQILDGGLSAWVRCGLPLDEGAPVAADHPAAERVNDFLRQTIAGAVPQILGKAAFFNAVNKGGRLVIDGRPRERFAGRTENLDARPGHVPGAVNRPATENLDADGYLKSREALCREWGAVIGSRDPRSIVQMCGSGVAACLNAAALDAAGILPIAEAALYPGSWSQWAADSNLPAESGY